MNTKYTQGIGKFFTQVKRILCGKIWGMNPIPYIDEAKIQAHVNFLNTGLTQPQWAAIQGENGFVGFNFDAAGKTIFHNNFGYPVKLFFNIATGELKMFPITLFTSYR